MPILVNPPYLPVMTQDFCKMMSVYDNLNENKGLDKESANYLIDDLVREFNSVSSPILNL